MKALISFVLLAACSCPQKPTSSSGTTTTTPGTPPTNQAPANQAPAPTPDPAPGSASGSAAEPAPNWSKGGPGMGENCGPNDACAQGLTCVSYYGIAGARGPQFKTCEIKCKADSECPAGHKCVTIADGPGQVCRK